MPLAGDPVYATDITKISQKPAVRLVQQAGQALALSSNVALQFGVGSEEADTHGFHSETVNNSRVTPTVAGWYRCTASLVLPGTPSGYTNFNVVVAKNNVQVSPYAREGPNATAAGRSCQTTTLVSCNGTTDYVESWANQTSATGVAVNTATGAPFQSCFDVVWEREL